MVIGRALLAAALSELGVVVGGLAVGGQELDGGLKPRAGQTGVGVGTFLVRRAAAVAVGKAGLDTGEVVFEPIGVSHRRLWVMVETPPGDLDARCWKRSKAIRMVKTCSRAYRSGVPGLARAWDALHYVLGATAV
jgi:hypothetical protein